jgi:hypothetical protein
MVGHRLQGRGCMLEKLARSLLVLLPVLTLACSGSASSGTSIDASGGGASSGGIGGHDTTGTGGATGAAGVLDAGTSSGGATGTGGAAGATGAAGALDAGTSSGGATGTGRATTANDGGDATVAGPDGSVQSFLPAGYKGTPFKVLTIPGTIHAADYDLGGAGVAYCHGTANDCAANIMTTDWRPAGTPPYRPLPTPGDKAAGGAAANDNAGICHMDDRDKTTAGVLVTPPDACLCYMVPGEWVKYTVQVQEAGTYSVGAFVGSPAGVTVSLDFGAAIMTGAFPIPASPTANCKCTETYHSWQTVDKLAMVTFQKAGTYLMTFTVVTNKLHVATFTFSKM